MTQFYLIHSRASYSYHPFSPLNQRINQLINNSISKIISGGKPITPTGDSQTFANGGAQQLNGHTTENGTTVVDGAIKSEVNKATI